MVRYILLGLSCFLVAGEIQAAELKCGGVYKVQTGDSLGVIAARAYGRSSQYPLIYSANSHVLKSGPSSIRVGQQLKIPCDQTASGDTAEKDAADTMHPSEALFYAARDEKLKQVDALVRQGANVNFRNRSKETPMHAAASTGRVDVLHYLHSRGARYNASTTNRWLPLHHAVRFGHVKAAQYLIRIGSPVHASTRDNITVFDMAYATRNGAMVRMLNRYRR